MKTEDYEALPFDEEMERLVLKILIYTPEVASVEAIPLDVPNFFVKEHAQVFELWMELYHSGAPLDETIMIRRLIEQYGMRFDWRQFVRNLSLEGGKPDNLPEYCTRLTELHERRRLMLAGISLIEGASDVTKNITEVAADAEVHLDLVRSTTGTKVKVFAGDDYKQMRLDILQARQERRPVMSGWDNLDRFLVEGFAKPSISVIAARPSTGKSAYKSNLIKQFCEAGFSVLSVATEQSAETETDRMDALVSDIALTDIMNSRLWANDDPRVQQIKETNDIISRWPYFLLPSRGLTIDALTRECKRIAERRPIDLMIIDLFDKIKDVNVAVNKAQSVGVYLGVMNQLAEELNCHICLLVQVQRRVEDRRDHRPRISDIKDSGSYEEVARLIMLLFREKYYNPNIMHNHVEVTIGKQNNGIAGMNVTATFELDTRTLAMIPVDTEGRHF